MHWSPKPLPNKDKVKQLQIEIGVPHEIACLLIQRGIQDYETAKSFSDQSFRTFTIHSRCWA